MGVYNVSMFTLCMYLYIFLDSDLKGSIQSLILVFVISFLGTYSKHFYESMIQMIFNFEVNRIPAEINSRVLISFAVTNWLIVVLLSSFFGRVLKNYFDNFVLIVITLLPSLLYMVALFFSFLDTEG